MTPDLMEAGAQTRAKAALQAQASGGRRFVAQEPYFGQGVALYLDDITVSFDGFRALNSLSLTINVGASLLS